MDAPPVTQDFANPFTAEQEERIENGEPSQANAEPVVDVASPKDEIEPPPGIASSSSSDEKSRSLSDHGNEDESRTGSGLGKKDTAETAPDEGTGVVEKIRTAAHKFRLEHIKATGPTRFLNPTLIHMNVRFGSDTDDMNEHGIQKVKQMALMWRSRDNRKGRNSVAVSALQAPDEPTFLPMRYTPKVKGNAKAIGGTFWKMLTTFPYWDMAFWSGWSYTIGSFLFVMDGILAWGPVAYGDSWGLSKDSDTYGGPLCFFFGALFYQVGAVMAYLEAVNDGSFHGAAMRRLLEGHEEDQKKMLDDKVHGFFSNLAHRHRDEETGDQVDPEAGWRTKEARHLRPGSIYPGGKAPAPRRGAVDLGGEEGNASVYSTWQWYPSWRALRQHHVYEIGWLACTIQLFGVTLYGVTAIVVLPGIESSLAWWQKIAAFWVPQLVAASCFLIASLMFMFETQEKWWKPELKVLGWWIGFWATAGSVGFVLIAIFGLYTHTHTWASYQSDLTTIWGSAAYLISSFLQWYEALNKNPVEELFTEPGEMKSHMVHPI